MVLSTKMLFDEKDWHSLRCSAHCLQLCINSGLLTVITIENMIVAAKKLVNHFQHSVVASVALKGRQNHTPLVFRHPRKK